MKARNLIDLDDFSMEELDEIVTLAGDIIKNPKNYAHACDGKILATVFYEPSTRTQMSFQTAMLRLGGSIIGIDNPAGSSITKGENLKDTIKIIGGYADIIVMRTALEGAAKAGSIYSKCPIINAGDGGHLHPTQTLTDVTTLSFELGRLDNITIGLCGDLKYGRTVHSLVKCMVKYKNNKFVFISTPELTIPDYIREILDEYGCEYSFVDNLNDAIPELDVLYMTRIQRERFETQEAYEKQKGIFVLDTEKLKNARSDLKILHPLPRVDEITDEVDYDPRAIYFKQAVYGMYARMALIMKMLENSEGYEPTRVYSNSELKCKNPKCVTVLEPYLPTLVIEKDGKHVCEYCDKTIG
ncbi:MAG: aspartate carbamoyltransferase [Clostridia bacterium]|nr:aspartate carbamoyltransferase [Clostridia bacterium]